MTLKDVNEFEPQFGDKIMVKDRDDSFWGTHIFISFNNHGLVLAVPEREYNSVMNTDDKDKSIHGFLFEKWKWPEQEEKELEEISKLSYHQRDTETDRIRILEGKVEEMIDVVNKLING